MKVLVIGSGGREHAICYALTKSSHVDEVFAAPGNGGIAQIAKCAKLNIEDNDEVANFCVDNKIELCIIGPEDQLAAGLADTLEANGIMAFGPGRKSAQLESSKSFAKNFMNKYGVPTAASVETTDAETAKKALKQFKAPYVIKADGLCKGKGVIIAEDIAAAEHAIDEILVGKAFGDEGSKLVIEEYLNGIEASLLCFVAGDKLFPMRSAKDYKRIYEGDLGENTGGVGCFSPNHLFTNRLSEIIRREVLSKIEKGLREEGLEYTGILFIGFMIDGDDVRVLEFNTRFGDPETEVLMPVLRSDLVDLILKSRSRELVDADIKWADEYCVTVVLTSDGYPASYEKGKAITIGELSEDMILFHNGTKLTDNGIATNGGRVLSLTATGASLEQCREKIYSQIGNVSFDGCKYRRDIAKI